jgi:hypothetical protein
MREDAKKNLEMAGLFDSDSDYSGMIGHAVMKLVNTHLDEGHSGGSHEMVLFIFNKVIRGHALTREYWDLKEKELNEFAVQNMGEPWKEHILKEILGEKPETIRSDAAGNESDNS